MFSPANVFRYTVVVFPCKRIASLFSKPVLIRDFILKSSGILELLYKVFSCHQYCMVNGLVSGQ